MNIESQVLEIYVNDIIPNRFQPRLSFDEQKLSELAQSIKNHGIIQPLVLRKIGDKYEIVAGERRYKAALSIGLNKVPAIITDLDDDKSAEIALVENLQRKDLTSIEEAKSFKKLLDRGYLTQEQLAEKMGLSQSAISNKLRLLNLSEEVQNALLQEKISERHARSLLAVSDKSKQIDLLSKIQAERLTVRQLDSEIELLFNGNEGKMENIEKNEVFELPKTFVDAPPTFEVEFPSVETTEEVTSSITEEQNSESQVENIENLLDNNKTDTFSFFSQPEQQNVEEVKEEMPNVFGFPSFEELSVIPSVENNSQENQTIDEPIKEEVTDETFSIDDTNISNNSSNEATLEAAVKNLTSDFENPKPQFESQEEKKEEEPIQKIELKIDKSNFRTVENAFENLKKEIIDAGLKIDMDTYNFDQYYQLIIKVYK